MIRTTHLIHLILVVLHIQMMTKNKYLKESREKLRKSMGEYATHANKAENDLSRIFILVATIIIPLSTPAFFNNAIFGNMELIQIISFSFGWFSILASLTLGLIYFVMVHGLLKSGKNILQQLHQDLETMKNAEAKTMYDYQTKEIKRLPKESRLWPLKLQIIFLFLGLFLFAFNIIWSIF